MKEHPLKEHRCKYEVTYSKSQSRTKYGDSKNKPSLYPNQGIFPAEWKKANVVLLHTKGDHQCVKNYRPVSLLPVFSKIFERLIYNAMLKHFLDKNLISSNNPLSKQDSCINQLIAITHHVFKGFDDGLEIRSVALDISKAFDKV